MKRRRGAAETGYWVPLNSASDPMMRMTPTATTSSLAIQARERRSGNGW